MAAIRKRSSSFTSLGKIILKEEGASRSPPRMSTHGTRKVLVRGGKHGVHGGKSIVCIAHGPSQILKLL